MSTILVIDDSATTAELVVGALTSVGYDAVPAIDLASIDARLAEQSFDAVLVDVNMPEMYGDDVVEFLRAQRNVHATMLLYSALPEDELERKARASGAAGYISKSMGLEHMLAEVSRYVGIPVPKPRAAPTPPPPSPTGDEAVAPPEARPRKRVLIVDDSEVTSSLLQAELQQKGFEVMTADSADKATKIILKKQTRPDLLLLDVRMPNVNGEQFCRFIKSNALFKGIKVLLCSGEDEDELKRICRDAGADGYVTKDAVLARLTGEG